MSELPEPQSGVNLPAETPRSKVAVIGAGWAGCAAAVEATRLGHAVTLFEASRTPGGRARRVDVAAMDGVSVEALALDNGQHILIGAYAQTLRLMADLGVDPKACLLRLPLTLQFPDGNGLKLPTSRWVPAPLDAFAGILSAQGWSARSKLSLLWTALGWQLKGFQCDASQSVADLCKGLDPGAMAQLIEPLCVSALNTPADRASGQVFLRVMRDALFGENGGSNLLLPRVDLGALLPDAALAWLQAHGGTTRLGARVQGLQRAGSSWQLACADAAADERFDHVVLACPAADAARLVESSGIEAEGWINQARGLHHEALTTVFAHAPGARLRQPMLAMRATASAPAQFVIDRGQLGGPVGLLAFVISASEGEGSLLTAQVLAQAADQLGLSLRPVKTIVEKRATFSCTPGLQRPGGVISAKHEPDRTEAQRPRLLACGDYIAGPYPATLEGAVMSGLAAARCLDDRASANRLQTARY